MTNTLATLDPGKNLAGVAHFVNGTLKRCSLIRAEGPLAVGNQASDWFNTADYDVFLCEGQQIYPGARAGNPNDLVPLAFCCGVVSGLVQANVKGLVLPRVWTGGCKKEIRLARCYAELTPAEQKLLDVIKPASLRHNVLDAVAMGRWYLKQRGLI